MKHLDCGSRGKALTVLVARGDSGRVRACKKRERWRYLPLLERCGCLEEQSATALAGTVRPTRSKARARDWNKERGKSQLRQAQLPTKGQCFTAANATAAVAQRDIEVVNAIKKESLLATRWVSTKHGYEARLYLRRCTA